MSFLLERLKMMIAFDVEPEEIKDKITPINIYDNDNCKLNLNLINETKYQNHERHGIITNLAMS